MTTRDRILDGAAQVMRSRGVANTTTKEIAKAAGLSEAMLYKVFDGKVDLFLGVFSERLPRVSVLHDGLSGYLGRDTVAANLRRLTGELVSFYLESFPIAASVFSDPDLLRRHREELHARGAGPDKVAEGVTEYLSAEQNIERIAADAPTRAIAELLVGACLHRAFLARFADEHVTPTQTRRFAREIVGALLPILGTDPET